MIQPATYIIRTDDGYQHELVNVYAWEESGWLSFYADKDMDDLAAGFSMATVTSCCRADVKSEVARSRSAFFNPEDGAMN